MTDRHIPIILPIMSTEIETFRSKVEHFMEARGISPTRFGREYARDPRFVFELRDGREPRTTVRHRIISLIEKESVSHSDEV